MSEMNEWVNTIEDYFLEKVNEMSPAEESWEIRGENKSKATHCWFCNHLFLLYHISLKGVPKYIMQLK